MAKKEVFITPIILKGAALENMGNDVRPKVLCLEGNFDYKTRKIVKQIAKDKGYHYYNYKDWESGMGYDFTDECIRENDSFLISWVDILNGVRSEGEYRCIDGDMIYAMYNLVNIAGGVVSSIENFLKEQAKSKLADTL